MKSSKLFFMAVAMVLTGCVETIIMDPYEKDLPVVVNCIMDFEEGGYTIKPGKKGRGLSLTLQYAKGKSQSEFIPVEDAEVYLERPGTASPFLRRIDFIHTEGCTWESDETELTTYISPNERYILKIEIPDRETIWAETWTQPNVTLTMRDKGNKIAKEIEIEGHGLENYCLWAFGGYFAGTGSASNQNTMEYLVTDNPNADGFNISGKHISDLFFQGTPTDDLGFYYQSIFNRAKNELSDMPLHDGFIRIDNLYYGKPFFIFGVPLSHPGGHSVMMAGAYSRIDCYFVSDDLDKYLRSAYVHNRSLGSNLTYLYSTNNEIYSNIHGGLGIFGSRYVISYNYLSNKY